MGHSHAIDVLHSRKRAAICLGRDLGCGDDLSETASGLFRGSIGVLWDDLGAALDPGSALGVRGLPSGSRDGAFLEPILFAVIARQTASRRFRTASQTAKCALYNARMAKRKLILDRYKPLAKAGAGGFGTVQVAWDTRIQRKVAIKCIRLSETELRRASLPGADAVSTPLVDPDDVPPWEDLPETASAPAAADASAGAAANADVATPDPALSSPDPGSSVSLTHDDTPLVHTLARIPGLDEARTAAMLSDQNIVTVYDFEIQDSIAYLIMEYVEGMTLTKLLRDHGAELTLDAAAAVFAGVAHALEVAHESQVLHLDIKPDNILINLQGQVKVTDFGLATLADASGYGRTGGGTVGYMPLEQMRSESLDVRCDEWALASVTYEMLSGENPFFASDLWAAQEAIEEAELVLPSLCWDDLDEDADDVLFMALDPDREERFESVGAFAAEFEPLLGDARQGKRELAAIVQGPVEEELQEEEAAPRVPLRDRITERGIRLAARACGAAGSALLAFWSLSKIPQASGVDNPLFWGIGALVALAGGLRPHLGALLGFAALSAACLFQGSPAVACLFFAATIAWWWLLGRYGDSLANSALAVPLAGALGVGPLAPLAAGLSLRTLPAMGTALFQVFTAFVLAGFGSGSLIGWDGLLNWPYASHTTQGMMFGDIMFSMICRPETWVMAGSWVLAAGVCALACSRPSRALSVVGAVLGAAMLLVGAVAAAGFESAWASLLPDVPSLAGILASGALAVAACFLLPDWEQPEPEE